MWDACELPRAAARSGVAVEPYGTDVSERPGEFDALRFIDEAVTSFRARRPDGVMASDDYPGSLVAAAIARELGLRGPDPAAVLRCQHKYYSRLLQRSTVPGAVPEFTLLDPARLDGEVTALRYPVFVKPVKSFFSILARPVGGPAELRRLAGEAAVHLREFVRPFDQLLARYTTLPLRGGLLLAEEPMRGAQVTVEAYLAGGEGEVVGVTDSVMYPGTISFARFEYPSVLPADVQRRMGEVALSVGRAAGLDHTLFNVEMFYDPERDAVRIIELNPRMCPQFADLMEKVNGVNTYEIALALALGDRPVVRRPGAPFQVAASFVLRRFQDARVRRVPGEPDLAALATALPDARVKVLCRVGHRLSEELQDGMSFRYAVVNLGGRDRDHLRARFETAMSHLPFGFDPS